MISEEYYQNLVKSINKTQQRILSKFIEKYYSNL